MVGPTSDDNRGEAQRKRLELVAKAGDEWKQGAGALSRVKVKGDRQPRSMAEYILVRLRSAGFTEIKKESTVYRLRTEARKLGLTEDTKGTR